MNQFVNIWYKRFSTFSVNWWINYIILSFFLQKICYLDLRLEVELYKSAKYVLRDFSTLKPFMTPHHEAWRAGIHCKPEWPDIYFVYFVSLTSMFLCAIKIFYPQFLSLIRFYEWNIRIGNDSHKKMWQFQMFHL